MRFKSAGNKADLLAVVVHNADTVTIPPGSPVILFANGTNDGLDVVLPSTMAAAAQNNAFKYGITGESMAVGAYSDAIVFGFHPSVVIGLNSRANSNASWSTQAAISAGAALSIDSVNNVLTVYNATFGTLSNSTAAALGTVSSQAQVGYVLGGSLGTGSVVAAQVGSASSTADTRIVITSTVKALIRIM